LLDPKLARSIANRPPYILRPLSTLWPGLAEVGPPNFVGLDDKTPDFCKTFPICIFLLSSFSTFLILQNFCKMMFY